MKIRAIVLFITIALLASGMAAVGLPMEERAAAAQTAEPTAAAPSASPTPDASEPLDGLGGILERMRKEYDPTSGTVAAYRWAESVLAWYLADGRSTENAEAAGENYAERYGAGDKALQNRLSAVQTAAEALTSGENLGLVCDRRVLSADWEDSEAEELFSAIRAGAGIV